MSSDSEYGRKVANFLKKLRPLIREEEEFYKDLEIGTQFWIPCAGIESRGIPAGHLGQIKTYSGNKQWTYTDWITEEEAESSGIKITFSHGSCPGCSEIFDEILKSKNE